MAFPSKTNYLSGDVLTAAQMNDIGSEINALNGTAGKNKIINGDFAINQRAFTSTTTTGTYGFDRFRLIASDGTTTYSAQTFTLGAAPVAGYEGKNFARVVSTGQTLSSAISGLRYIMEDVRSFAGQTVTVSFWAKAATGSPSVAVWAAQNFGTGGSPSAEVTINGSKQTISTSWARYSFTLTIPSISGKTLGTDPNNQLSFFFATSAGSDFNARTNSLGIQSATIDFWGMQAEAGNTATAFQTATGTLAGELALAQRYYQKSYNTGTAPQTSTNAGMAGFIATGSDRGPLSLKFPVNMRTAPTLTIFSETGTSGKISNTSGGDVGSGAIGTGIGESGFRDLYATSGLSANNGYFFHYTASAEL